MPRILVVDDDPLLVKLVETTLRKAGYETFSAGDGEEALRLANEERPDLIVLDVAMPGIDGFEVARRIRRSSDMKHIIILVLTASSDARNKVEAFSIGVNDYMTKPFEVGELVSRVSSLLRHSDQVNKSRKEEVVSGQLVAVHSLRGGLGCSSLAINVSAALQRIWSTPVILLDNVFTSGQIALLLDTPVNRTWIDFAKMSAAEFSEDALYSSIAIHSSGLHFLPAPSDPVEAERVDHFAVSAALSILKKRYEYIVADLSHDFSDTALEVLESADELLLVLSPEIVSVRLAAMTLKVYNQLDIRPGKIHLVLIHHAQKNVLKQQEIEEALHHTVSYSVPYDPTAANRAIATGKPFVSQHPRIPLSAAVEEIAYYSSKPAHRESTSSGLSSSWKKVTGFLGKPTSKEQKGNVPVLD